MPKTIELNNAAYERLKINRREDESWSEVIQRLVPPKRSIEEILTALKECAPSLETLDAAEESMKRRRRQRRTRKV